MFDDHTIPDDLSPLGKRAAQAVIDAVTELKKGTAPYTGGCRAFYSPNAWRERSGTDDMPRDVVLVVVHDGGDFAPVFNLDYCQDRWFNAGERALSRVGCWAELYNSAWTYVYRNR